LAPEFNNSAVNSKDLTMLEWEPGGWYLAVTCRNCGVEFPFSREGEIDEAAYFTDSGRLVITCPDCRFPLDYSGEMIKRVQAKISGR